ncbi:hypothetical protein [Labedaea rhizosphaerae]|uniref:Uncharacterized protein n=1 Tax=Labedaea rhizosphaerae TaxID=598644 RepID=A0A4R6SGU6_LABRH|nr:hypothetical protein [Labedaea rhizosphaerae]TDQ00148.1 hypothetical protein EV186_1029 [Labedaea rhizosphaerae]
MPKRPVRGTTAGHFWTAAIVLAAVLTTVVHFIPIVVETISDLVNGNRVGHDFWEVVGALWMIVGTPVLVLALLWPEKMVRPTPPGLTREEEQEERRAWLADLREQGAPWHQLLLQRLSLTFVAIPVMTMRRLIRGSSAKRTARDRVHLWTISFANSLLYNNELRHAFGTFGVAAVLAGLVVVDRLLCRLVASPRRRARAAQSEKPKQPEKPMAKIYWPAS